MTPRRSGRSMLLTSVVPASTTTAQTPLPPPLPPDPFQSAPLELSSSVATNDSSSDDGSEGNCRVHVTLLAPAEPTRPSSPTPKSCCPFISLQRRLDDISKRNVALLKRARTAHTHASACHAHWASAMATANSPMAWLNCGSPASPGVQNQAHVLQPPLPPPPPSPPTPPPSPWSSLRSSPCRFSDNAQYAPAPTEAPAKQPPVPKGQATEAEIWALSLEIVARALEGALAAAAA